MKIRITNTTELQAAIDSVESKAKTRLISIEKITDITSSIEKRLIALKIPKSQWKGAKFIYENGYKMPASYNGRPESTQFSVERFSSDWFITGIYRGDCDHNREITFVNESEFKQFYKF